jgi:hypothetical protein
MIDPTGQEKKITLPSGAILGLSEAPFRPSKALYQALAQEMKAIKIDMNSEVEDGNFWKDLACSAVSSPKIEEALAPCLVRCTYNNQKIDNVEETFGPASRRQDYLVVCYHVMEINVSPFLSGLFAKYSELRKRISDALASRPETTTSS